jgi:hypothetical protein
MGVVDETLGRKLLTECLYVKQPEIVKPINIAH